MALQDYDIIPKEMRTYLRNHGRHFNKKACEWAISKMKSKRDNSGLTKITPLSKEDVDNILKAYGVSIDHINGYDHIYVANMCKADFYGSSIKDDAHLALYIKDVLDDPDGAEGQVFNRWLADMDSRGESIDWIDLL